MSKGDFLETGLRRSLSGRLLVLTMIFVIVAEIFVFVPSIARFRETYLSERLEAAYLAAMSVVASPEQMLRPEIEAELLDAARVYAVTLRRPGSEPLTLARPDTPAVDDEHDLYADSVFAMVRDSFATLLSGGGNTLRIAGMVRDRPLDVVEVILDDTLLHEEMVAFSIRILGLSLVISLITAGLVYITLLWLFVYPMRRLTRSMTAFGRAPEDPDNIIRPGNRGDEIGIAERELARLQEQIRAALKQKKRLADLGAAVTKINHDLRNSLASAHLISDRLADSADPAVKRLTPRLVRAINHAIDLCTQTLKYGKAEEPPPRRIRFELKPLLRDVGNNIGLPEDGSIDWRLNIPDDLEIHADPEQIYRIIINLGRNAVQAIESSGRGGRIEISAERENGRTCIEVADDGPGVPDKAREHLFQAFTGSAREGGTGLGLAIVHELVGAHGGTIELIDHDGPGAAFRIIIPDERKSRRAA